MPRLRIAIVIPTLIALILIAGAMVSAFETPRDVAGPVHPASVVASHLPDSLWLGNDSAGPAQASHIDTNGNLINTLNEGITGFAYDGQFLYSAPPGMMQLTRRNPDDGSGPVPLDPNPAHTCSAVCEDMAFDGTNIWRVEHHNTTLYKIDPTTGTVVQVIPLTPDDPGDFLDPLGNYGIARDPIISDQFWMSFGKQSILCAGPPNPCGIVMTYDLGTDTFTFRFYTDFLPGGLDFDPAGNLWVGTVGGQVHKMSTAGVVLDTVTAPGHSGFIDGLEYIEGITAPPLDHFWCYQSLRPTVQLQDQFDLAAGITETATLAQPQIFLCNPASKVHAGQTTPIQNPDHHLMLYPMRAQPLAPTRQVTASNQFGDNQVLTLGQPQFLAIPTQKLPHPAPEGLDHFKCYQVTGGASVNTLVALSDQFQSQPEGRGAVSTPAYFCNPVKKVHNGVETPILNPEAHLVCYEIARIGVNVTVDLTNQFGNETLHLTTTRFLCVPSQKITPQPSGKIAFSAQRDGNREIYVMNADGSGQTNLTNNPASDNWPAWSPDGTKIAFYSDRDGNFEVYVMNVDGSNPMNLTNNSAEDGQPSWSPDGTKIAFYSRRDGNSEIYVMNADGSSQTRLTADPANDEEPSWSPDGTKIAFTSQRDGNREIYLMNADGSGQTRLTNDPALDVEPEWSPDGTKIAFSPDRDGNREIYVMNADGTGQTNLTNNPAGDGNPGWSPDGTKIAFHSDRDGNGEIYVMNADGTGPTRLTNNPANDDDADWGPP